MFGEDGRVQLADYLDRDTIANIANVAADYGEIKDMQKDGNGELLSIYIDIPRRKFGRALVEIKLLSQRRVWLGHLGYVLGLHSAIYIATDRKSKRPIRTTRGDYSGRVQAVHVYRGDYMWVSISKDVYENLKNPRYLEDYIYLKQLKEKGENVVVPEISNSSYEELLTCLTDMINAPMFMTSREKRVRLARRYAGIVVGLMVKWGFKDDIKNLVSVATSMALDDRVHGKIYQSLIDAVKLAQNWGDLR